MNHAIKLSEELVQEARQRAGVNDSAISDQIEYWAGIGKAIEPWLYGGRVANPSPAVKAKPVAECLGSVDSPEGRQRVREYLNSLPYPHYEAASDVPDAIVRVEADGKRTVGRFVEGEFHPIN